MSAIEEFDTVHREPKRYYFLDYLSVNQYKPQADIDSLQDLVSQCEYCLLIFLPR